MNNNAPALSTLIQWPKIATPPPMAMLKSTFIQRLRIEGSSQYHDVHPFHILMHQGLLSKRQLQRWVENRYYYQTRIPIKDALILSKSEDPIFRRAWIHRIVDHDGTDVKSGGLAQWLRLASAVGLDPDAVASCGNVLAGVRFACDAYVELVRQSPLVVAVASSLTEMFAPDLMSERIKAWELHYPWVDSMALDYFRVRVNRARRDGQEGLDLVLNQALTYELQEACIGALIRKTQVLWQMLDCIQAADP
jgi:pyrroloquinoline-quinone synthase